jgi:hypothetical protein
LRCTRERGDHHAAGHGLRDPDWRLEQTLDTGNLGAAVVELSDSELSEIESAASEMEPPTRGGGSGRAVHMDNAASEQFGRRL